ncbi:MAG: hypothetical protein V1799_18780 [bacterium]
MPTSNEIIYHPLLPKLKQGSENRIGNFKENGVWDKRDFSELDKLSDSLKVERVASQINSIPDVWARPLLFEMAFFDSDHLLHYRTVAEWRGLLALLAFKEIKGFSLRIIEAHPRVKRTDENGNLIEVIPKDAQGNEQWPRFLSTVAKMASNTNTLEQSTLWIDAQTKFFPFVVLNNDKPIGILSPTTLVCTATDCFNRLNGVNWSDGRFLKDPSGKIKETDGEKTNKLNQNERRLLAAWIDNLLSALSSLSNPNHPNPRLNKLLRHLSNYIADLGGVASVKVILSTRGFGLTRGIFQYLDKPLKGDGNGLPNSHLQLLPSEGRTPAKTIFVIDRSIAQQWNMPETNIVVYKGATLADIPPSGFGTERSQIGGIHLQQDKEEICLPEDIFTTKLCVIYQANALPGAMLSAGSGSLTVQGQIVTPLLPFTDKVLSHISNDDLQKNIVFEQSSEGGPIQVRLRLRLSGPDGKGKLVEFRREYHKDTILVLEGVPVLEIWPNFRKEGWQLYFTYYSKTGRESTFYAKPFVLDGVKTEYTIKLDRNRTESEITQTDSFPSAVKCFALGLNLQLNRMDEFYAGLIILKAPEKADPTRNTWKIGIDFGTTSTTLYTSEEDNEGEPLLFREELTAHVTESTYARLQMRDEFIPRDPQRTPFLSFYQQFREPGKENTLNPFCDGHIFFLDPTKVQNEIPKNVATNLKWSEDEIDRYRATAFLEQVYLQALAEAASKGVAQVGWRYSYPTAFSEYQSLKVNWQQIISKYSNLLGIPQTEDMAIAMTESAASAIYFADNLKASTKSGTVCIDVGGGTSDVAIWQNNALRHQVSFRLAGREIFLNTLRTNPDFLKEFESDISRLIALKARELEFCAHADAIIAVRGEAWLKLLNKKSGKANMKKFVQIIAVGLSGIFYYVGLILKHLAKKGEYDPQLPDIYMGGNGSKLFHWISEGSFTPQSSANILFRDSISRSSGLEQCAKASFKIILSQKPKEEAASGLVGKKILDIPETISQVISGECFLIQGKRMEWSAPLSVESFKNNLTPAAHLEQMESFAAIFNTFAARKDSGFPPLSNDIILKVHKRLGDKLSDIARLEEKKISVEPLFILALKTLLEICSEEWKSL